MQVENHPVSKRPILMFMNVKWRIIHPMKCMQFFVMSNHLTYRAFLSFAKPFIKFDIVISNKRYHLINRCLFFPLRSFSRIRIVYLVVKYLPDHYRSNLFRIRIRRI